MSNLNANPYLLNNIILVYLYSEVYKTYRNKGYHSQPNCALAVRLRPITVKHAETRPIAGGDLHVHVRIRYYSQFMGYE